MAQAVMLFFLPDVGPREIPTILLKLQLHAIIEASQCGQHLLNNKVEHQEIGIDKNELYQSQRKHHHAEPHWNPLKSEIDQTMKAEATSVDPLRNWGLRIP